MNNQKIITLLTVQYISLHFSLISVSFFVFYLFYNVSLPSIFCLLCLNKTQLNYFNMKEHLEKKFEKQIIMIQRHGNIFLSTVQNIIHKFKASAANMLFELHVCHQWRTKDF